MTETKPKYISPYTCPMCASTDHKEIGFCDRGGSVGYDCECATCGTDYTYWENIDYTSYCVEIDGQEYPYEKDEPRNPGLQAALSAYGRLKSVCSETARSIRQHLDGERNVNWQRLHDDLVEDMERAAELLDRYAIRSASDDSVLDNLIKVMEQPCSESREPR